METGPIQGRRLHCDEGLAGPQRRRLRRQPETVCTRPYRPLPEARRAVTPRLQPIVAVISWLPDIMVAEQAIALVGGR